MERYGRGAAEIEYISPWVKVLVHPGNFLSDSNAPTFLGKPVAGGGFIVFII